MKNKSLLDFRYFRLHSSLSRPAALAAAAFAFMFTGQVTAASVPLALDPLNVADDGTASVYETSGSGLVTPVANANDTEFTGDVANNLMTITGEWLGIQIDLAVRANLNELGAFVDPAGNNTDIFKNTESVEFLVSVDDGATYTSVGFGNFIDNALEQFSYVRLVGEFLGVTNVRYRFRQADFGFRGQRIPELLAFLAPCSITGDQIVDIGGGTTIEGGVVCSNGDLNTGPKVAIESVDKRDVRALGNVKLGEGTELANHDLLANGDLFLAAQGWIGGNAHIGNDLRLGDGAAVAGTCYVDGGLDFGLGAQCGAIASPSPDLPLDAVVLPECAVVPPVEGSPDITTAPKSDQYYSTPLTPGDYGNVHFGNRNKVALEAGEYHFQSLKFGASTEIELRGPVTLHVVEELRFADGVTQALINVDPNEIVYLVNGEAETDPEHRSGAKTVLYGTFCGPQSHIAIGSGSTLIGGIIGKSVEVGAKVHFTADPAPVK